LADLTWDSFSTLVVSSASAAFSEASSSPEQLRAAVNGELADAIFSPQFVRRCRRELVAADD
jgi:hypothetical protein